MSLMTDRAVWILSKATAHDDTWFDVDDQTHSAQIGFNSNWWATKIKLCADVCESYTHVQPETLSDLSPCIETIIDNRNTNTVCVSALTPVTLSISPTGGFGVIYNMASRGSILMIGAAPAAPTPTLTCCCCTQRANPARRRRVSG